MNHIAPEVYTTFALISISLAIATIAVGAARLLRPKSDFSELVARVGTWWVIIIVFFASLWASPTGPAWLFAFVSYLALKEFLSMTPTRQADRRVLVYVYLSIVAQYYFAAINWYGMFIVFIPVIMFIALPARMIMIGQTEGFLRAAGSLHWGLMLTVFSLAHTVILVVFDPGHFGEPRMAGQYPSAVSQTHPGPGLLIFLVLTTELNDIFQYLWGKTLGVRKVAPTVSPGKTYAGFVGGVSTTIAFAFLIGPRLTLMDWRCSVLAGVIIAFAGFLGDLCMSAIKRDLKIKDFGSTLPGHGGVLDRVDSMIFTAPLFFHFVFYLYG